MDYQWIEPTLGRISDLLRMPAVHNSYAMPAVSPMCAWAAIKLIWGGAAPWYPIPRVLPTEKGGLRFEWHGTETSLEMIINPDGMSAKIMKGPVTLESANTGDDIATFFPIVSPMLQAELFGEPAK